MPDSIGLFFGGLMAGMVGGSLGIGGGVVLMPILRFVVGLSPAHAAGTCITAVFFTTLGGSYRHYRRGTIGLVSLTPIVISGAVFTVMFSLVFLYLSTRERWLDLGMGLVFAAISLRMIAEGIPGLIASGESEDSGNGISGTMVQKLTIGSLAGALPGLLGIGTGVILVPSFVYILGSSVKIAMASSLACFSVNALISSIFKYEQGFVDLVVSVPVCLGALLGANLGVSINRRASSRSLKLAFGLVFLYVSLKFILSFAR